MSAVITAVLIGAGLLALAIGAEHRRDVVDCRNVLNACDHSELTPEEDNALSLALHQRNLGICMDGWGTCDHSKLSSQEASAVCGCHAQEWDERDKEIVRYAVEQERLRFAH